MKASDFYAVVAQQHLYWAETFESEGAASFALPGDVGAVLVDQGKHSLIKDMITRLQVQWPRYGVCGGSGGCAYGDPKNNGFQEILTASLATSLEMGMFPYAKTVLANYLQFYLRGNSGLVYYRGFEMAQAARSLTLIAQYVQRTGDGELPLKYFNKIQGTVALLQKRRAKALLLPKSDAAYERCPAGFLFLFSKLEDPDEALYHTMTHPYDSSPLEDPDEQCYGDYCDYRDYRDESAAYTPAVSSRVDHSRVAPHLC